jgi:hypothetical protein
MLIFTLDFDHTVLSSAQAQLLLRSLQCFIMPFMQNGTGRRDKSDQGDNPGQERLLNIIAVDFDNASL